LSELRKRIYLAGAHPNQEDNLVAFIVAPDAMRPGTAMPRTGITEAEARAVAQFLYSDERDFFSRLH
jgi:cytochrome c1